MRKVVHVAIVICVLVAALLASTIMLQHAAAVVRTSASGHVALTTNGSRMIQHHPPTRRKAVLAPPIIGQLGTFNHVAPAATTRRHANTTATLSVPGAPGSVNAVPGNNQATVTWTAANPNGSPVTSYVITALVQSSPKKQVTVNGSTLSTVFSGLYGGTLYSFQVYAVSSSGSGPAAASSVVTITGTSSPYAVTVLGDQPSLYWRLGERAGATTAVDASGSGLTGTYGSATPTAGALTNDSDTAETIGSGLGGTTLVGSQGNTGLPSGDSDRTMEFWVNSGSSASINSVIASYGNDPYTGAGVNTDLQYWEVEVNSPVSDGNWITLYTGSSGVVGWDRFPIGRSIADGKWHQVAVSHAHGNHSVSAYVDGVYLGQAAETLDTQVTGHCAPGLLVGNYDAASGQTCGGGDGSIGSFLLDEFAIYPTALSPLQIANHYITSGLPGGNVTPQELYGGAGSCYSCIMQQYQANQSTRKPVTPATGNFWHTFADIVIPGRGTPLAFGHTYNSGRGMIDSPLGFGWTFNGNMSLNVSGSTATLTAENGSQTTFTQSGGTWAPTAPREIATLVPNGDQTWTLTRNLRDILTFSPTGQLMSELDLNGNGLKYTYNGSNQLASISDTTPAPNTRTLTIGWSLVGSVQRITSVSDQATPTPRKVTFAYDTGNVGYLTDVTDVGGGNTHFGYDAVSHLLTTIRDPRGKTVTTHYDSSNRVDWQTDEMKAKTSFAYVTNPDWALTPGTTQTTITSPPTVQYPQGTVTVETYQNGLRVSETRGYGTPQAATWNVVYDRQTGSPTTTTDPNGHTSTATYDSRGNELTSVDALGRTTTNTYDTLNDLMSTTDANNVMTTRIYDTKGNLSQTSTPLVGSNPPQNQVVIYHHDDPNHPGDVTSITDANTKTWMSGYDIYGNLTTSIDPLGNKTTSTYNSIGWKLSQVSPKGNVTGATSSQYMTFYGYDAFGRVTKVTDPLGHKRTQQYDKDGNIVTSIDANGKVTRYTYDAANELTVTTRADGTMLQTTYNLDGTMHQQIDGKGKATTYGYDSLGRVTSTADPLNRTTTVTYDGAGNRLTVTDAQGQVTTYGYDAANELTSVAYGDGKTPGVSAITYDANGRRTGMTDGTGTSTWTWDSLGRLTKSTNGASSVVSYGYDLANRMTSVTYPGQTTSVTRSYDDAGHLHTLTDWLGNTSTFGYDANSNLITQTLPPTTGVVDTFTVDNADRLMGIRDAKGTTAFASFTYGRDKNGQLTSEKNTGVPGVSDVYTYTSLNQLSSANTQAYGYDAADNLTKLVSGATQSYDDANQLCWSLPTASTNTCTTAPTGVTSYGYDQRGNRTTVTTPGTAALTLGYDQANRLTSYGTTASYVYDGDGLRASKTVGTTKTSFTWDVAGALPLMITDGTTSYIYGPGGLPLEQISGTVVTYFYHDQIGSTRVLTDATGKVISSYTYDAYGNTVGSTGTPGTPFKFAGEYQDSESGMYYLRARYYDPTTGQFISLDPLGALTRSAYGYVAGNPLNKTDSSGRCPWCIAALGILGIATIVWEDYQGNAPCDIDTASCDPPDAHNAIPPPWEKLPSPPPASVHDPNRGTATCDLHDNCTYTFPSSIPNTTHCTVNVPARTWIGGKTGGIYNPLYGLPLPTTSGGMIDPAQIPGNQQFAWTPDPRGLETQ